MINFKTYINEATLNIDTMNKQLAGVQRSEILKKAIVSGSKLETKKGNVVLNWINDQDRNAFDMNDFQNAFKDGKNYKKIFITSDGDELRLNDIIKTAIFGGGAGSGGGYNTGTGKELVARAVGLSQYVPFNKNNRQF